MYQNVLFPMKVTRKFSRADAVARANAAIEKVKKRESMGCAAALDCYVRKSDSYDTFVRRC